MNKHITSFFQTKSSNLESSSSCRKSTKIDLENLPWDPSERRPISSYHPSQKDAIRRAYLVTYIACYVMLSFLVLITDAAMEEGKVSKYGFEFMKSFSDNHIDVRPSCFSNFKGYTSSNEDYAKDRYTLIKDPDDFQQGIYDQPLPCFGCGVGWFSFLVGFALPLMWYYATFLYFGNYYQRDPRERAGLIASAIAAMGFSLVLLIIALILIF